MRTLLTLTGVVVVLGLIGLGVYLTSGPGGDDVAGRSGSAGGGIEAGDHAGSTPIIVKDDRGERFVFETPPKRIAALSADALETLIALGVTPVARFEDPNFYPPEAASIPTVARSHAVPPDIELLISQDPDLILLHWVYRGHAEEVARLVSCPVMVLRTENLEDVLAKFELLGRITGKAEQAEALSADLERTVDWLAEDQPTGGRPVALSLLGQEEAWYAHRNNHFMGSLLTAAGAENAAGEDEAHSRYRSLAPIDLERVIQADPEVIFIIPYAEANEQVIRDNFNNHPATQSLRAVRNGRVHVLPYTLYSSQPGPRTGQALRELYRLLYPDRPGPHW